MEWLEEGKKLSERYDREFTADLQVALRRWLWANCDRLIAIADIGGRDCGCPYEWHNHLPTCPYSDEYKGG